MTGSWLLMEQVMRERKIQKTQREDTVFCNLISEVTYHNF